MRWRTRRALGPSLSVDHPGMSGGRLTHSISAPRWAVRTARLYQEPAPIAASVRVDRAPPRVVTREDSERLHGALMARRHQGRCADYPWPACCLDRADLTRRGRGGSEIRRSAARNTSAGLCPNLAPSGRTRLMPKASRGRGDRGWTQRPGRRQSARGRRLGRAVVGSPGPRSAAPCRSVGGRGRGFRPRHLQQLLSDGGGVAGDQEALPRAARPAVAAGTGRSRSSAASTATGRCCT